MTLIKCTQRKRPAGQVHVTNLISERVSSELDLSLASLFHGNDTTLKLSFRYPSAFWPLTSLLYCTEWCQYNPDKGFYVGFIHTSPEDNPPTHPTGPSLATSNLKPHSLVMPSTDVLTQEGEDPGPRPSVPGPSARALGIHERFWAHSEGSWVHKRFLGCVLAQPQPWETGSTHLEP